MKTVLGVQCISGLAFVYSVYQPVRCDRRSPFKKRSADLLNANCGAHVSLAFWPISRFLPHDSGVDLYLLYMLSCPLHVHAGYILTQ